MERRRTQKETEDHEDIENNINSLDGPSNNIGDKHSAMDKIKNDKASISLLFFLYILQGIPLGLAGSIPMILQNRNISYKDQAIFSFVTWPFSIKLLWAPIVDSLFWRWLGRRKTWLIPTQYCIGLFMIVLSGTVESLLGEKGFSFNIYGLTAAFFIMNFLAATQDIAVDGWALTMLSKKNVGYASTCNSVGQTAGFFLGNVVFQALESKDFCNNYLRSVPQSEGIVTLPGFLKMWGIVFLIATTLVLVFKPEKEEAGANPLGIKETYLQLRRVLCLRNVWLMIGFLMTAKIGFSATDAATGLKMIEAGVKKENLAILAIPMVPLQILLPLLISKYTSGPRPLSIFLMAYPFRLLFNLVFLGVIWWTHYVKMDSGEFPLYYYAVIVLVYGLQQISVYSIFVALMSFFAQVSDPSIGGTYMTLLNTICNLGGNWPATLSLWLLDPLTTKRCDNPLYSCDNATLAAKCSEAGSQCSIVSDGYYILTVVCTLFGFVWLRWGKGTVRKLQQLPASAWKCPR